MKLVEFIEVNKINISEKYILLCEKGIKFMEKSLDANHADAHIHNLLEQLHVFIEYEDSVKKKDLDFEVLLPSICWHDVWKSTREQTRNLLTVVYEQIYEGFGSRRIFKEKSKYLQLEKEKQISGLITFHPGYEFLPGLLRLIHIFNKSVELLIINDLDRLESINVGRVRDYVGRYMYKGSTDPKLFRLAYFWVNNITFKEESNNFHFSYTKKQFEISKEKVMREAVKILKELLENKEYYFDMSKPDSRLIKNFKLSSSDKVLLKLYG